MAPPVVAALVLPGRRGAALSEGFALVDVDLVFFDPVGGTRRGGGQFSLPTDLAARPVVAAEAARVAVTDRVLPDDILLTFPIEAMTRGLGVEREEEEGGGCRGVERDEERDRELYL